MVNLPETRNLGSFESSSDDFFPRYKPCTLLVSYWLRTCGTRKCPICRNRILITFAHPLVQQNRIKLVQLDMLKYGG